MWTITHRVRFTHKRATSNRYNIFIDRLYFLNLILPGSFGSGRYIFLCHNHEVFKVDTIFRKFAYSLSDSSPAISAERHTCR